jgi:hypothetical protein
MSSTDCCALGGGGGGALGGGLGGGGGGGRGGGGGGAALGGGGSLFLPSLAPALARPLPLLLLLPPPLAGSSMPDKPISRNSTNSSPTDKPMSASSSIKLFSRPPLPEPEPEAPPPGERFCARAAERAATLSCVRVVVAGGQAGTKRRRKRIASQRSAAAATQRNVSQGIRNGARVSAPSPAHNSPSVPHPNTENVSCRRPLRATRLEFRQLLVQVAEEVAQSIKLVRWSAAAALAAG